MGNAAAIQSVAESSRRRLLVQQYNRQPRNVVISHSFVQAVEQLRLGRLHPQNANRTKQAGQILKNQDPLQSLPLDEIYDVLRNKFGVQLTLEELPAVLRYLNCRVVESPNTAASSSDSTIEWYSLNGLVEFIAPRRVSHQLKRPPQCPYVGELSHCNVTVWQAAKMGDLEALKAICTANSNAYRALDNFENSPLYYASLCGREVVVDFLMKAYERQNCAISSNELLRCVTNALTHYTRAVLQQKMTLCEVLKAKALDIDGDRNINDDNGEGELWIGIMDDE